MNNKTKTQQQVLMNLLNAFWDKKEDANRKAGKTKTATASAYADGQFEAWADAAMLLENAIEDIRALSCHV